jgi:hypothetical protein
VALSFLYMASVRLLQVLRLCRTDRDELAIEVVLLRHEVSILRRQVERPAMRPTDRAVLASLSRILSRTRRTRFFVQPETPDRLASGPCPAPMDLSPSSRSTERSRRLG